MFALLDLLVEVVRHIISTLADSNRGRHRCSDQINNSNPVILDVLRLEADLTTMSALSRACRLLRHLTRPFLWSFLWLPRPTISQLVCILKTWDANPECAGLVRRLHCHPATADRYISENDTDFVEGIATEMCLELPVRWSTSFQLVEVVVEVMALRAINNESLELNYYFIAGTLFKCLLPTGNHTLWASGGPRFSNLRHLYLAKSSLGTPFAEDGGIQHILDEAPNLTSLETNGCAYRTPFNSPKIARLSLASMCFENDWLQGTLLSVNELVHFETDTLYDSSEVGSVLLALARHSGTLKSLAMSFGRENRSFNTLSPLRNLANLETITTYLTDVGSGSTSLLQFLPPSLLGLRLIEDFGNQHGCLEVGPWIAEPLLKRKKCGFTGLRVSLISQSLNNRGVESDVDYEGIVKRHRDEVELCAQEDIIEDVAKVFGDHKPWRFGTFKLTRRLGGGGDPDTRSLGGTVIESRNDTQQL